MFGGTSSTISAFDYFLKFIMITKSVGRQKITPDSLGGGHPEFEKTVQNPGGFLRGAHPDGGSSPSRRLPPQAHHCPPVDRLPDIIALVLRTPPRSETPVPPIRFLPATIVAPLSHGLRRIGGPPDPGDRRGSRCLPDRVGAGRVGPHPPHGAR